MAKQFKQLLNINFIWTSLIQKVKLYNSKEPEERPPTTKKAIFIQTNLSYKLETVKLKHAYKTSYRSSSFLMIGVANLRNNRHFN